MARTRGLAAVDTRPAAPGQRRPAAGRVAAARRAAVGGTGGREPPARLSPGTDADVDRLVHRRGDAALDDLEVGRLQVGDVAALIVDDDGVDRWRGACRR